MCLTNRAKDGIGRLGVKRKGGEAGRFLKMKGQVGYCRTDRRIKFGASLGTTAL